MMKTMKYSSWFPTISKTTHKNKVLDPEQNMIGILTFEVSRLMSKVANLWHCLSTTQMSKLQEELRHSLGIRTLVSDDHSYLVHLALEEIISILKSVAISVARLGKKCSDPVYHNLDNVFNDPFEIDLKWRGWEYRFKKMEKRVKKMKKFAFVTSRMYKELDALSELETQFAKMQSDSVTVNHDQMQEKVTWHRAQLSGLREISPWVRSYDYIVRLLLRSLFTLVERIKLVFGITTKPQRKLLFHNNILDPIKKAAFSFGSVPRPVNDQEPTLGQAALALLYANIIIFIESLAKSPRFISSDARDDLYDMLTPSIKHSLRQKLLLSKKEALFDERIALDRRSSVKRILDWLSPLAHNMIRWYSEGNFVKNPMDSGGNVLLVQTLYYADKAASEVAIRELIVGLHYASWFSQDIIDRSFLRYA